MTEDLWRLIAEASPKNGNGWSTDHVEDWMSEHERRDAFIRQFSFAVPTPVAVGRIKRFVGDRKLLEAGAGSGLWARLLSDAGVVVTALDNGSWRRSGWGINVGKYYPVERCDAAEAVKQNRDHQALMVCWPDYNSPMAAKTLDMFEGDRLIYIGEGSGGCTGDDRFHEMLESWQAKYVAIPQWPGIHDEVVLYARKQEP